MDSSSSNEIIIKQLGQNAIVNNSRVYEDKYTVKIVDVNRKGTITYTMVQRNKLELYRYKFQEGKYSNEVILLNRSEQQALQD